MTKTKSQKARARAQKRVVVKIQPPPRTKARGRMMSLSRDSILPIKGNVGSSMQIAPAKVGVKRASYFRVASINSKKFKNAIQIQGQDYLSALLTPGACPTGTNIFFVEIGPSNGPFNGTRLSFYAQLYEKYCFKKLVFHYSPGKSSATDGSLIMAYDKDPTDPTPPANVQGVQNYLGYEGAQTFPIWEPASIVATLTDTQDFYYTNQRIGDDERLSFQGQIYLAALNNVPTATQIGDLWVEYELELYDPQLQVIQGELATQHNGAGTTSTTSRQGWNDMIPIKIDKNDPIFTTGQDASGNWFVNVPGGTFVVNEWISTPSAAVGINVPSVIANYANEQILTGTTSLFTVNAAAALASGAAIAMTALTIPKGGAKVYGNLSAAVNYANHAMRIWNSFPGFI